MHRMSVREFHNHVSGVDGFVIIDNGMMADGELYKTQKEAVSAMNDYILDQFPVGQSVDWKFNLCTREVFRLNKEFFEIHDFSDGWSVARFDAITLIALIKGEKSILDLNWE